jgi:hypothetical protein
MPNWLHEILPLAFVVALLLIGSALIDWLRPRFGKKQPPPQFSYRPGDTLIFSWPQKLTVEQQQKLHDFIERKVPGAKVIVLCDGMKFEGVIHEQKSDDAERDEMIRLLAMIEKNTAENTAALRRGNMMN